jgi:hypothetical protein
MAFFSKWVRDVVEQEGKKIHQLDSLDPSLFRVVPVLLLQRVERG